MRRLDDNKRLENLGEAIEKNSHKDFSDMKNGLLGTGDILIEDVKGREGELLDIEKDAMSR